MLAFAVFWQRVIRLLAVYKLDEQVEEPREGALFDDESELALRPAIVLA